MKSFNILFLFLVSVPFLGIASNAVSSYFYNPSNTVSSYFCNPSFDLYEPSEDSIWELYMPQEIKWGSYCIYDDGETGDFTLVDCNTYQFVTQMEDNFLMKDGRFVWRPFGIMPDFYRVRLDSDNGIFHTECFELKVRNFVR